MAVYEYEAVSKATKKTVNGVIDADSPAAARRKLREQDLFPTALTESYGRGGRKKGKSTADLPEEGRFSLRGVRQRDVALMTRQLAVLLNAGVPLVESLGAMIEQTPNPRLRKAIYDIRDKVNGGVRLAEAMSHHQRIFSDLYTNMVGAGEASGALEQVLFRIAEVQEKNVRLSHKVRSSLAYPAFMAIFGVAVIVAMMTFIVPTLTAGFAKQGRDLPQLTLVVIATSKFIGSYWWLLIGIVIMTVAGWRFWLSRPAGRYKWDTLKFRWPLFAPLYVKLLSARFTRTLGTMLQSGLTLMTALDVVKTVLQNKMLEEAMDDVKSEVRRGRDLGVPLRELDVFPPMVIQMIELGQRSGELEGMLLKVADTYDEEVEMTVEALVGLLEPMMIVVMGVFVGILVIAMLLPILTMSRGM